MHIPRNHKIYRAFYARKFIQHAAIVGILAVAVSSAPWLLAQEDGGGGQRNLSIAVAPVASFSIPTKKGEKSETTFGGELGLGWHFATRQKITLAIDYFPSKKTSTKSNIDYASGYNSTVGNYYNSKYDLTATDSSSMSIVAGYALEFEWSKHWHFHAGAIAGASKSEIKQEVLHYSVYHRSGGTAPAYTKDSSWKEEPRKSSDTFAVAGLQIGLTWDLSNRFYLGAEIKALANFISGEPTYAAQGKLAAGFRF